MDRAGALVFFPCGACDVSADNGFDGEDFETADLHGAVLEGCSLGGGDGGGEVECDEVVVEGGEEGLEDGEPVGGEEG